MFGSGAYGGLGSEELLDQLRRVGHEREPPLPEMVRIVVAIDPSGCSGPEDTRSDEIGIIVVGLGTDQHAYLLEDLSGRYKPEEWGRRAADAYDRHRADRIIREVNFGGDMVRSTIHAVNSDLPYNEVRGSRGKHVRAEPISALYDQGKVHHLGYYPELEEQMCAMLVSGYVGLKSPDRLDALVWALTELFPNITEKRDDYWRPLGVIVSQRTLNRRRI